MALLTGTHTFQDQLGVKWILDGGKFRVTLAGRGTEQEFGHAETRTLSTEAEEVLLYSVKERMQIRCGCARVDRRTECQL